MNWYLNENGIEYEQVPPRPSNHPFNQTPFLTDGDDEYLSFDTKNLLGTNNEIRKVIAGDLYSSLLYEDIENLIYSYNPDKNGVFIKVCLI